MGCEEHSESLTAYMDGELTAEQRSRLDSHLEQCDRCRREYESLNRAHRLTASLPLLTARPESWQRVRSEIALQPVASPFQLLTRWMPLAAALLVAVFLSLFFASESDDEARRALDEYVRQRDLAEARHVSVKAPLRVQAVAFEPAEEEPHPNPFAEHFHNEDEGNPFRLE